MSHRLLAESATSAEHLVADIESTVAPRALCRILDELADAQLAFHEHDISSLDVLVHPSHAFRNLEPVPGVPLSQGARARPPRTVVQYRPRPPEGKRRRHHRSARAVTPSDLVCLKRRLCAECSFSLWTLPLLPLTEGGIDDRQAASALHVRHVAHTQDRAQPLRGDFHRPRRRRGPRRRLRPRRRHGRVEGDVALDLLHDLVDVAVPDGALAVAAQVLLAPVGKDVVLAGDVEDPPGLDALEAFRDGVEGSGLLGVTEIPRVEDEGRGRVYHVDLGDRIVEGRQDVWIGVALEADVAIADLDKPEVPGGTLTCRRLGEGARREDAPGHGPDEPRPDPGHALKEPAPAHTLGIAWIVPLARRIYHVGFSSVVSPSRSLHDDPGGHVGVEGAVVGVGAGCGESVRELLAVIQAGGR